MRVLYPCLHKDPQKTTVVIIAIFEKRPYAEWGIPTLVSNT